MVAQGRLPVPLKSLTGPRVLAIPILASALETIVLIAPISLTIAPLWTGSYWDYL